MCLKALASLSQVVYLKHQLLNCDSVNQIDIIHEKYWLMTNYMKTNFFGQ